MLDSWEITVMGVPEPIEAGLVMSFMLALVVLFQQRHIMAQRKFPEI